MFFWNSLAFSVIQWMLAIWSLVPLPFLRSLIHFEFILCMILGSILISFFYVYLSRFPSTTYWRGCLFSIVYSYLLCCRLGDFRSMGLYLGFLSCTSGLYFCFCASTILFWWLYVCSTVRHQEAWFLQLCFSFSTLLWLFWVFCVSIQVLRFFLF